MTYPDASLSQTLARIVGLPTDAASSATDATSVSGMQVQKQISASTQAAAASLASMVADTSPVPVINGGSQYETVAASQSAQVMGATGAVGDYLAGVLVIPATTTPGVVTILDAAISIPLFVGGALSVSNLVPFFIPLGLVSVSGAWKITTGANVSCIGIGKFT